MEKETKHYVESLNHDPNWLHTIIIEIDKLLINCEYTDFFMQMHMKCIKDNGSNLSFQKLIIPLLPRFEKLDFSQFKVYIETEKTTHFVCAVIAKRLFSFNLLKINMGFCILHMLMIHPGLRKLSKQILCDIHL